MKDALWLSIFCFVLTFGNANTSRAELAYEIPRSVVQSIAASKSDRTYDLYIKLPPKFNAEQNKDRRYPVVYLNDGTYCFQTAAGVTHLPMNSGAFEHAILVGLSYSHGDSGAASRSRDMTPTVPKNLNEGHGAQFQHGKADEYMAFLRDDVLPFIESEYRGDPQRRILVGQSYGALFGAYVLVTEPAVFNDYLLTSPSLWHNEKALFGLEQVFAKENKRMPARVYFATGENEGAAKGNKFMVANQKEFATVLRNRGYNGLEIREEVIPDATHYTTFPVGLTRGLSWFIGE